MSRPFSSSKQALGCYCELHCDRVLCFGSKKKNSERGASIKAQIELRDSTAAYTRDDNVSLCIENLDLEWTLTPSTAHGATSSNDLRRDLVDWEASINVLIDEAHAVTNDSHNVPHIEVSSIGSIAGVINLQECSRFIVGTDNLQWPKACRTTEAFRLVTEHRTYSMYSDSILGAKEWRQAICLSASLCHRCGHAIVEQDGPLLGQAARGPGLGRGGCIGLDGAGRLYHTQCFGCVRCLGGEGKVRRASAGGAAGADVADLFVVGGSFSLLCLDHTRAVEHATSPDQRVTPRVAVWSELASMAEVAAYKAKHMQRVDNWAPPPSAPDEPPGGTGGADAGIRQEGGKPAPPTLAHVPSGSELSEEERLAVMMRVKSNDMTVDEAVDSIKAGIRAIHDGREAAREIPLPVYCLTLGVFRLWAGICKIKEAPPKAAAMLSAAVDLGAKKRITAEAQGAWPAVDFEVSLHHDTQFAEVRRIRNVSDERFQAAFRDAPLASNLLSGGRSAAVVLTTRHKEFVVKTLGSTESKVLSSMVDAYVAHFRRCPQSLIVSILAVVEVRVKGKSSMLMVMENVSYSDPPVDIHEFYDLKGSTVGRRSVTNEALATFAGTRKDMDMRRHLTLGKEGRAFVVAQLELDVALLKSVGVMDYSFFVAVHDCVGAPCSCQGACPHASKPPALQPRQCVPACPCAYAS